MVAHTMLAKAKNTPPARRVTTIFSGKLNERLFVSGMAILLVITD
jgi:hypothetical protein